MRKRRSGFTIVELLIVIVVIGILAAITIVAYGGVQTRAVNTARYTELRAWQQSFELYKAQEGDYPTAALDGYCLGSGFPVGGGGVARCRDYGSTGTSSYQESTNTALMTELKKVGTLPSGPRTGVNGTVGPYANYYGTTIDLTMVINGSASDCPSGTAFGWTDGAGRLLCRITLTR